MTKGKTSLTFYGGVDEIGGNKILVKDGETKIFLDFGMSFGMKKLFYSPPFLSPKSEKSLQELGILPRLEGIYRFDDSEPDIDAVFISHSHLDHAAYLSFVKRQIPIYCGETAKIILTSLSEVRRAELEFDVEGLKLKAFRTGDRIKIGSLTVEPVHVDHSVPGAYGFVIHTSQGAVVYTGDFRAHGAKPEMTQDFLDKARDAEPVAVVTEATNLTGASISSEREVEGKLRSIVNQTSGIVFAGFASADVDRLNSFYRTAKSSGRCLAVSMRQACLLDALRADRGLNVPDLNDPAILIFRRSKQTTYSWEKEIAKRYTGKVLEAFEVSKRQCKTILALSFYDLEELVSICPESGSCYIVSSSEPFNEEMEIDHEKLINWLKHYGLPQYHVHVSGHVMPLQLKASLKEIDTRQVFPIHTEHADLFCRFMRSLDSKIIPTKKAKEYVL